MTYLRVKRLIVYRKGQIVFDQVFPNKINNIRGENGSGKSTISNFIYYALGGDFIEWLPEARSCDNVFLEVEINQKVITLKREVIDRMMQPMFIYLGPIENALKSAAEGWEIYPYRKSDNKESFSQFLFRALEYPEVSSDNNETITLNQILRVLYIDQISPLNTLLKTVDFDSPLIRQALGYLLLGIYDNKLFNQQLELKEKRKELGELEKEFKAVQSVYRNSEQTIDINFIEQAINDSESALEKIDAVLQSRELVVDNTPNKEEFTRIRELQAKVQLTSTEVKDILNDINRIKREILDSEQFVSELKRQIIALQESSKTREVLGELDLSYCPSCLSKLAPVTKESTCKLCKQEINKDDHSARVLRISREIENQIKESEYLLEKKKSLAVNKDNDLVLLRKKLNLETKELDSFISRSSSKIERKYDDLLIRKGELRNQITNFLLQKQSIVAFLELQRKVGSLRMRVATLEEEVKGKEEAQRKKMSVALERIQYYSLKLLKGDGNYEDGFANASRITADFSRNLYAVDERNNFSASSLVILKNSIRFGIFFASLELDFMRYPRFIFCDNIEDKGMREERSHNFQKNIVELANSFGDVQFQMIFTTSMIDETLDVPSYTIGDYYLPTNKSLNINRNSQSDNTGDMLRVGE